MRLAAEHGVRLVGLEAAPGARPIGEIDLGGGVGLAVGSEGRGLRRLVRETCDVLGCLPRRGRVGSLNAAVAGAMALYEAARQREG
jgi:23S rRNA (guanosine2251-2'-O)-methyltransferase